MFKNTNIYRTLASAYTTAMSSLAIRHIKGVRDTKNRRFVPYTLDGEDGYFAFNIVNHTISTDKVSVYDGKMVHLYDILYLNFE